MSAWRKGDKVQQVTNPKNKGVVMETLDDNVLVQRYFNGSEYWDKNDYWEKEDV